jgi:hypothetical protein
MIGAVLALESTAVSARGAVQGTSTASPILVAVLAGLGVVMLAVVVYLLARAYKARNRTIESIRRLIQDADVARTDPVLVHQARRRIRSTGSGRH